LFLYRLAIYHWKVIEKNNYNFVIENTSIKTHMKKLYSHKVSNIIVLEGIAQKHEKLDGLNVRNC
jgi:hypothetical protein